MEQSLQACPSCGSGRIVKSGIVKDKQRFSCKSCGYHFTVNKLGKKIDDYYVIKALQLFVEGVSIREIERLLGVSHSTIASWVKQYKIKAPAKSDYHPTYKILSHSELVDFMQNKQQVSGAGMIVTELGDKFMVIRWERFRV
jgi:transposase-like protein